MKSLISAVILSGGKGERSGADKNKVLCYFGARTALECCLDALTPFCDKTVVVAAQADLEQASAIACKYGAEVITGGNTRTESVKNGLSVLSGDGIVLIHDAARPFVSSDIIKRCIASAEESGSGIAAIKVADAVKTAENGIITGELDRSNLYYMQTPQAFELNKIKAAYEKATRSFTDDSAVYMSAGFSPVIVEGRIDNKKITYPEDMLTTPPCSKVGLGVDFHRLDFGRRLIIGGVQIPYERGLVGNSDADVLTHAVMDALLSASGNPDIGVLFPCTDEYKDADSIELLCRVTRIVEESGFGIASVSATIMAKAPKMQGYIPKMRSILSSAMGIDEGKINISATTTEGLGIIGNGDGMASSATALLYEKFG